MYTFSRVVMSREQRNTSINIYSWSTGKLADSCATVTALFLAHAHAPIPGTWTCVSQSRSIGFYRTPAYDV
jgi:hypothetical protein